MQFQPGHKKKGGRKKGTPNKATKATQEAFQALLDQHWDNLDEALMEVRADDAAAYIKLVLDIGDRCVPRLKSIEHSTKDGEGFVVRLSDAL